MGKKPKQNEQDELAKSPFSGMASVCEIQRIRKYSCNVESVQEIGYTVQQVVKTNEHGWAYWR